MTTDLTDRGTAVPAKSTVQVHTLGGRRSHIFQSQSQFQFGAHRLQSPIPIPILHLKSPILLKSHLPPAVLSPPPSPALHDFQTSVTLSIRPRHFGRQTTFLVSCWHQFGVRPGLPDSTPRSVNSALQHLLRRSAVHFPPLRTYGPLASSTVSTSSLPLFRYDFIFRRLDQIDAAVKCACP